MKNRFQGYKQKVLKKQALTFEFDIVPCSVGEHSAGRLQSLFYSSTEQLACYAIRLASGQTKPTVAKNLHLLQLIYQLRWQRSPVYGSEAASYSTQMQHLWILNARRIGTKCSKW